MERKRLLYLAYTLPEHTVATGDRHATAMLEEFSRDFDVHLAAARCTAPGHRARHAGYAAGVHLGDLHGTLDSLARGGADFPVVVLERAGLHHLLPALKVRFPRARTVVNAIDIEYRREYGVAAAAKRYGVDPRLLSLLSPTPASTRRLELALYRRADFVVTVSGDDRDFLVRDGVPARKIFVCRIAQPPVDTAYNPDGRYLTFVGYADHVPNYVSMKAFIDTVYPRLKDHLAARGRRIAVIGRDLRGLYDGLKRDGLVEAPGHLDLAEIRARYYSQTCLSLAPLVAGSGVKGKVLEAMAHRLPVVTTDVGLQGLEEFEDCVARIDMDDPEGAARRIVALLEDGGRRAALSERAARRLLDYNRSDDTYRTLRMRLDTLARLREPEGMLLGALMPLRRLKWRLAG